MERRAHDLHLHGMRAEDIAELYQKTLNSVWVDPLDREHWKPDPELTYGDVMYLLAEITLLRQKYQTIPKWIRKAYDRGNSYSGNRNHRGSDILPHRLEMDLTGTPIADVK